MPTRFMIDIETLDTAVILEIGVVRFDPAKPEASWARYQYFPILSQRGRTIGKQSSDARDAQASAKRTHVLARACAEIGRLWCDAGDDLEIWAKPPSFDLEILWHAAEAENIILPSRRTWRDVRTLLACVPPGPEPANALPHSALQYALHQARTVSAILRRLHGQAE
ncbi:MAG: hypothetical protein C4555_04440 [Dehalococcoidia bacterium]|nr:MAG: hypothetical protein C4555_04440 [Dehalococcoidia bacterium]